jgi:diaminopimelate epimerase
VDDRITVRMPGGNLFVEIGDDEQVYMTGPVEKVFDGCFHPDLEERISAM